MPIDRSFSIPVPFVPITPGFGYYLGLLFSFLAGDCYPDIFILGDLAKSSIFFFISLNFAFVYELVWRSRSCNFRMISSSILILVSTISFWSKTVYSFVISSSSLIRLIKFSSTLDNLVCIDKNFSFYKLYDFSWDNIISSWIFLSVY